MTPPSESEKELARMGRRAALILAGSMLLWLGAQFLGGRLGWDLRLAFVFDLLAFVGVLWALWITYQVYRRRRADRDP